MTTLSTSRSTTNTPGEHVTDHNTLHTLFNAQAITVTAPMMSRSVATLSGTTAILAPGTTDSIGSGAILAFPDDWATVHVDIIFRGDGLSPGAFHLQGSVQTLTPGGAVSGSEVNFGDPVVVTHLGSSIDIRQRVMTSVPVVAGSQYRLKVTRTGLHADDTSAGNMTVSHMVITKASSAITVPANRNIGNTGAQHISDHNVLHEAFNEQRVVLGPAVLFPSAGATSTNGENITMPNAGTPRATGSFFAPADWATVNIDVQWWAAAGAGNVRVTLSGQQVVDGVAVPGVSAIGSTTLTGNGNLWGTTRLATGYALTAGAYHRFLYLDRLSADGLDTLAGDVLIYGLIITKAS
jgi:hypothetical protein